MSGPTPGIRTTSAPPRRTHSRLVALLGWCSVAWLVAAWITLDVLGDREWWTVAILFGPRWLLAAPWLGCIPWLMTRFRQAAIPSLAGLAIAVFPVMGMHLGLHRASPGGATPFRVMELNADGGRIAALRARIVDELNREHPDVVVIAECGPELQQTLAHAPAYEFRNTTSLCLLSRGPVLEWSPRDPRDVWIQGGSGAIVRAVVTTPDGPLRVGLVHLATPRQALGSYFDLSELPKQGPSTRANIAQRDEESGLAHDWIFSGAPYPTVVAGDFNLPVESAIYRRHWADLENAFGRAGVGTGYTKHTRRWGVRIDHVLTSDDVGTVRSFVGTDVGSDHMPLIADLVLPKPAPKR